MFAASVKSVGVAELQSGGCGFFLYPVSNHWVFVFSQLDHVAGDQVETHIIIYGFSLTHFTSLCVGVASW